MCVGTVSDLLNAPWVYPLGGPNVYLIGVSCGVYILCVRNY